MENGMERAFACASDGGHQAGLTKREYFAIQIATGLCVQAIPGTHNGLPQMEVEVPLYAVRLADALLKALETKSE